MVRAIFIRHGQSTANVGIFSPSFAEVPLTELGHEQAERLAATWESAPELIAVSPYLRAQQTAAYTIARFPDVPVETWPIFEFTYWAPEFWENRRPESYPEEYGKYWGAADPAYRQGGGAETFSEFLGRARETLRRLAEQPDGATVLLFTHGHFMQAIRFEVLFAGQADGEKMRQFRAFDEARKVKNTQCVPAVFDGVGWTIDSGE